MLFRSDPVQSGHITLVLQSDDGRLLDIDRESAAKAAVEIETLRNALRVWVDSQRKRERTE